MSAQTWLEAMRLRTLPVSISGVLCAIGLALASGAAIPWGWAILCLLFAILAQVASNFANEYFDVRDGIDRPDRQGPQRGIIPPRQMLRATCIILASACLLGLLTLLRGGLWMLPAGIAIALGALAYSAGPWPLSRHCLGEVAVVIFFGLVPVCLTYWLLTLTCPPHVIIASIGIGLMGAMVILVNNYRDIPTDRAVGKHTLSTRLGPQGSALLYLALGQLAAIMLWLSGGLYLWGFLPILPAALGFAGSLLLWRGLPPAQATRLLAVTALTLLLLTALLPLLHA